MDWNKNASYNIILLMLSTDKIATIILYLALLKYLTFYLNISSLILSYINQLKLINAQTYYEY